MTLYYINIYFGFFGHPEVYYFNITWHLVFISAVVSYYARRRIFDMEGMCLLCYNCILGFLVWAHHIVYRWYGRRYSSIILQQLQYIIAVPTGIKIFSC